MMSRIVDLSRHVNHNFSALTPSSDIRVTFVSKPQVCGLDPGLTMVLTSHLAALYDSATLLRLCDTLVPRRRYY
jgi:saccharopine dehydrogenase-like NADP-dependent oxidoreductase